MLFLFCSCCYDFLLLLLFFLSLLLLFFFFLLFILSVFKLLELFTITVLILLEPERGFGNCNLHSKDPLRVHGSHSVLLIEAGLPKSFYHYALRFRGFGLHGSP